MSYIFFQISEPQDSSPRSLISKYLNCRQQMQNDNDHYTTVNNGDDDNFIVRAHASFTFYM